MNTKTSEFLKKFGPLIGLILLCIAVSLTSDKFYKPGNLMNILRQSSITALLALGVLLPILTGGIDLSVGSIQGFTMCFMALIIKDYNTNTFLAIILTLMLGFGVGLINGLLLTELKLPHPFISTLGMLNIARGMALIITDGMPISGLPKAIRFIGGGDLGDIDLASIGAALKNIGAGSINFNLGMIPVSVMLLVVVCILYSVILNHTPFGRYVYAIGGSREAARLSGVNIKWTMNLVFASSGLLSALAGIVLAGRVNSGYPLAGQGSELDAIAGTVIGGTSLFGGEGSVSGTIIGVLIMGVLRNGLNLNSVSANWQMVIIGAVVILAVWVDVLRKSAEYKAAVRKI